MIQHLGRARAMGLPAAFALAMTLLLARATPAAPVINIDSTMTAYQTIFGNGAGGSSIFYRPEALIDTSLSPLVANQAYHLTLHLGNDQAYRLDAAPASLTVAVMTQNRAPSGGSEPTVAANAGTVQLIGPNVAAAPLNLDFKDEDASDATIGVSLQASTTFTQVKLDPSKTGLVTDLAVDFTTPATFTQPDVGPYFLYAVDLIASQDVVAGETVPPFAGFATVPEPALLTPLACAACLVRRRLRA